MRNATLTQLKIKRLPRKLNTRTTPIIQTKGKHRKCKRNKDRTLI